MSIISLSGKIKSGKSTVASIIQLLIANKKLSTENPKDSFDYMFKPELLNSYDVKELNAVSGWQQKSFAAKLKQIVALLIGCTVEQLEDQEFKSSPLGKEWLRYSYADGFKRFKGETTMLSIECDKETYDYQYQVNWQTAYQTQYNPRMLMQIIGTDLLRDQLLNDVWVNGLFADYIGHCNSQFCLGTKQCPNEHITKDCNAVYPNWIVTDCRFPNEVQAIKERNGIVIRINRDNIDNSSTHESETALDSYTNWDYVLSNNGTIQNLIEEVRKMLIHFKII